MGQKKLERATRIVNKLGIVLVYPLANRAEPESLWSELYPGVPMEWSWDADADARVADLWHLREQLSRTHDVAYAKWFRGRATFFSHPVFRALLGRIREAGDPLEGLPREANDILDVLRERSPVSSKTLREEVELRGKPFEAIWNQAMKALWSRLLIVGTGEIPDGAFPSLAVAATELHFEDVYNSKPSKADNAALDEVLLRSKPIARQLKQSLASMAPVEDDL